MGGTGDGPVQDAAQGDGPRPRRVTARMIALAAIALALNGLPFYRQVLGGTRGPVVAWRMYADVGLHNHAVEATLVLPDGQRRPLDPRPTALGGDGGAAPRLLKTPKDLEILTRALCVGRPAGAQVHLRVREATPEGWREVSPGDADACASLPAPGDRSKGGAAPARGSR